MSNDEAAVIADPWEEFRGESEPIRKDAFARLEIASLPEDVAIWIMDDDFPETKITKANGTLYCDIEEHLYTKYWQHKFSAYAFSAAMVQAVRRLIHEGHPFSEPSLDDADVHIFVRWRLALPIETSPATLTDAVKTASDVVWRRAGAMLENSDSVLVLGKDTGEGLDRLKRIASVLEADGYYPSIIKEQPDRAGEGVIQKVMRYALSSKFLIIENTEPSGHLYEIPHVTKTAECVTIVMQEEGRGATWMFEDAYAKHRHWHKQVYAATDIEGAVRAGSDWAETFLKEYARYQEENLPWMKKP